jgi:2-keto-4-pentenoate hydratase/2-oxohepta-3-ene-1,7-dioic acid hydratase in catechol pathway
VTTPSDSLQCSASEYSSIEPISVSVIISLSPRKKENTMRIATFSRQDQQRVGIVEGDAILDLGEAFQRFAQSAGPTSVLEFIAGGNDTLSEVQTVVERAEALSDEPELWQPVSSVRLFAPIPQPTKNVFCVGRNYKLHIEEGARARGVEPTYPKVPEFFSKPRTAVIGQDDEIRLDPAVTQKLDYEVELAFVIGQTCRDVSAAKASEVIFGYTVLNDISARDLQSAHGQWFKGKGLDTSCPIGPWIVTADEFGSPDGHDITLRVNGESRQSSSTSDMLFDCAAIVESLSKGMTLEPGDIITTGTPSGVALGMVPQLWLKDGDVIEAEIEGIGILRNQVRAVS